MSNDGKIERMTKIWNEDNSKQSNAISGKWLLRNKEFTMSISRFWIRAMLRSYAQKYFSDKGERVVYPILAAKLDNMGELHSDRILKMLCCERSR